MAFTRNLEGLGSDLGQVDVGSSLVIKGSGMVAGALVGTAVLPVVGTIVGALIGLVGGLLSQDDIKHDTEKAIAGLKAFITDVNARGAIAYKDYHLTTLQTYYKYLTDVIQDDISLAFSDMSNGIITDSSFVKVYQYIPIFEAIAIKYTQMGRPYAPSTYSFTTEPQPMHIFTFESGTPIETVRQVVSSKMKSVDVGIRYKSSGEPYVMGEWGNAVPVYYNEYGVPCEVLVMQTSGVPIEKPLVLYEIRYQSDPDYALNRYSVRVLDTIRNYLISKGAQYPEQEDIADDLNSGGSGITVHHFLQSLQAEAQAEATEKAQQAQQSAFELAIATELQKYGITYGQYESDVEQAKISSGNGSPTVTTTTTTNGVETLSAGIPFWAILLFGGIGVSMLMGKKGLKGKARTKRKKG